MELRILVLVVFVTFCTGQNLNLLNNGDFETGISGWNCWGFKCDIVSDAHTGSHAVKASSRTQFYQGPTQTVQGLKKNTRYQASGFVKMLTDQSNHPNGQQIELEVAFNFPDNTKQYVTAGSKNGLLVKNGYVEVAGGFLTPNRDFTDLTFYFQGPVPGQEFLVDSMVLEVSSNTQTGGDMLTNGGFESGSQGWACYGFQCDVVTDAHEGSHALKVSKRTQYFQGPSQNINGLQLNSQYEIGSYVKMATDLPGDVVGQIVFMEIVFNFADGSKSYIDVAGRPMILRKDGFVKLHGDFPTPSKVFNSASVYFQGPVPGQEFIVDSIYVKPITADKNWRVDTDTVIDTVRKNGVTVTVHPGSLDPKKLSIEIKQLKKSFAFGTAIACDEYVHGDQRYQDFIHNHFNWAVTENYLKWDLMEQKRGVIVKDVAIQALKKLKAHGIKIRAHNIVWSVPKYVQGWLKALSPNQLKTEVSKRINWVVNDTKNYVEHWDVNNENIHGQYYQNAVNDRDYNLEIFREAHRAGPNIKLFLNDYSVVSSGSFTESYLEQALKFKNGNTGIYGIGVQCHMAHNVAPNPTLIKKHLDILAKAGLPIWVTELDVYTPDENLRAEWYEIALRALYGHPAVEGIMFWGFWSNKHYAGVPATIVTGNEFRINAAGKRVLHLLENEWMTKTSRNVGQAGNRFTVDAFHGDYELKVHYDGKERQDLKQLFNVDSDGKYLTVRI